MEKKLQQQQQFEWRKKQTNLSYYWIFVIV